MNLQNNTRKFDVIAMSAKDAFFWFDANPIRGPFEDIIV